MIEQCSSCKKELEIGEGVFKVDFGCYVYCGEDYSCMFKDKKKHGIGSERTYLKQYDEDDGEFAYYTTLEENDDDY